MALPPLDLAQFKLPSGPKPTAAPPTANSPMVAGMFPRAPLNPAQFKLKTPVAPASPGVPAAPKAPFMGGTMTAAPQNFFAKILKSGNPINKVPAPVDHYVSPGSPESRVSKPTFFSKILSGTGDLLNKSADNTAAQWQKGGEKIVKSITEGADKIQSSQEDNSPTGSTEQLKAAVQAPVGMAESALGSASGAVQAIFAPITGIIQAIADKSTDSQAMQDFTTGNKTVGGILDLSQQLEDKVGEIAKAHPEAAKNIADAANVIMAAVGGEAKGPTADIAGLTRDVAGNLKGQAVDVARDIGEGAKAIASAGPDVGAGVKKTADVFKKVGAKSIETPKKLIKGSAQSVFSNVYGLPADTVQFLSKNPHFATPEALNEASLHNLGKDVEARIGEAGKSVPNATDLAEELRQAATKKAGTISASAPKPESLGKDVVDAIQARKLQLRENAMKYPTGGNDALPGTGKKLVNVEQNWLRDQLENKDVAGVVMDAKTGRIAHGDAQSPVNRVTSPEGARRLQDLWDTWGPEFAKGKLTRPQFIRFRQDLAQLADYKGGVDTALKKAADAIRGNFNKAYRDQVPGLETLDTTHSQMSQDLDRLTKGLTVEDNTGHVSLQEGALQRIISATKDTKSETAKQLEELVPGITKKVQAIEDANAEVSRITHGLIDEKGNLIETAEGKIAGAGKAEKDILRKRLEELVPGISDRIRQMHDFKKEWQEFVDENGHLNGQALHGIKNSVNAGRDLRLEKLENLMPGITKRIRLVKAAEDFHASLGPKAGLYGRQGAAMTGALAGNAVLPVVGALPGWLAGMYATSPEVGLRVLRAFAKHTQE